MAHLTFYWDAWAIFDDDDVFRMIQREDSKVRLGKSVVMNVLNSGIGMIVS